MLAKVPRVRLIHPSDICKILCTCPTDVVHTAADICFRGCKVLLARSGGVTHWLVTPDDDGSPMTICWGQNANNGLFRWFSVNIWLIMDHLGELGLGPDERKSSSKPTRNAPLVGICIFE